jgi:hypothetical protein
MTDRRLPLIDRGSDGWPATPPTRRAELETALDTGIHITAGAA